MQCYNCGAQLTQKNFCTHCGVDVSRYKKLISFSNYYYNDGLSKANVRDLSGAVDSLRQCLKYNKYHIEARNLLGLVYFEMGESVAALSEWVISKNLRPEKNIADDYIDALQKSPAQLEAINQKSKKFNQALTYCYQGSKDLAVIQLKKLLSDHPNFVQAHLLLALLYIDASDWEKARKELNRCLRIDRANTMALSYMKEVESALSVVEEGKLSKKQKQKKAEDVVKYQSGNETIIQPVNALEPKKNTGWLLGLLAGLSVGVAVSWFLILPARVQNAKSQLNEKLVAISEENDRKNSEIVSLTQQVETLTNENTDLRSQTEALAGADGQMTTVEALLNAAYIYIETPDDTTKLSEAIEQIDRDAMESEDTLEVARNLYSKLLADTGTDLAKSYYDTGYKAYQAKDYETAIENLKKAVTYDADNEEALFALGNSYKEKGNKKLAIETYEKVIELFPGTEKARQSQKYIDQLNE
ncbi:MAG: tetratricopeptide repeat protein [Lachnospiraceae bacterium]|nr:tetratricopeptide repeat protein [Lachnospiraceae bacterium]